MDVMSIAKLGTSMAETGTADAVSLAMMKKSQDIASSTAAQLLEGVTSMPSTPNLPSHLGNSVNTTA